MNDDVIVEGTVENIVFQNQDNGYTVFSISIDDDDLVCIGYIPKLNPGENIKIVGHYIIHPTYGKQLNIKHYEKLVPTTEKGIEKYLASGAIKGVGDKLASRIVSKFGKDTLDIIENYPEKLATVRGISKEKANNISSIFYEQIELRKVMIYLQEFGISPIYSMKIYKRYKGDAISIIKENPYALSNEIFGIGFKTADKIAFKLGIDINSPFRIKAGVRHCLNMSVSNGNVCIYKEDLIEMAQNLLQVSSVEIENIIIEMQMDKSLIQEKIEDKTVIYLNSLFYSENYVAKKLLELSMNTLDKSKTILNEILQIEKDTNINLAEKQREAVIESMSKGVLVITGGPGTGKTTTINTIITLLNKEGYDIELAAPTGRAAKRMSEATGMEAKTIHRLLGINFLSDDSNRQAFEKNEDNPIEADVIIIDESSMVDINLMFNLLKAISIGTRLILVGDVDQLPSVGPGNVLKDIINSNCIKVVCLEEIFRQAQESAIIMNAHRINKGEYPKLNEKNKDFFFVKRSSIDDVVNGILDLAINRLPNYIKCDTLKDIQILTPMRKSAIGALNLNQTLQETLNPKSEDKKEYQFRSITFREGDKVMQIKNNYNMKWSVYNNRNIKEEEGMGVFNGDEGLIKGINLSSETITVCFDDGKVVNYDFSQLDELELSYAITIHKSQGSEYKVVIIPVHSGPPMLLSKNLLYTAVTRAKSLAVLIGIEDTLYRMVDNNREVSRNSFLSERIIKLNKFMEL